MFIQFFCAAKRKKKKKEVCSVNLFGFGLTSFVFSIQFVPLQFWLALACWVALHANISTTTPTLFEHKKKIVFLFILLQILVFVSLLCVLCVCICVYRVCPLTTDPVSYLFCFKHWSITNSVSVIRFQLKFNSHLIRVAHHSGRKGKWLSSYLSYPEMDSWNFCFFCNTNRLKNKI